MSEINHKLYTAAQVRGLDNAAIHEFDIAGYELMSRAGSAILNAAGKYFPHACRWLILCGPGNNGGDGYVLARLAAATGVHVTLCSLFDPERLQGDAATAYQYWCEASGKTLNWPQFCEKHHAPDGLQAAIRCDGLGFDLVIDALLGTGIDRDAEGIFKDAIELINASTVPVIAVDIPSGLNADTGCVMGAAVQAQLTVSFVGRKRGMFTAAGPDHVGRIIFDDLGVPAQAARFLPDSNAAGELLAASYLADVLKRRASNSHKGSYGEVLAIGGAKGMSGAILLCGEAALRSGAGIVRLATDAEHAAWINLSRPELMVTAISNGSDLHPWLQTSPVLALGPGLGRSDWSKSLLRTGLKSTLKMVLDADALNLMAEIDWRAADLPSSDRVLTPHPAEAARLLGITTKAVQQDRIGQAQTLARRFQAVVVLKGCGSVIASPDGHYAICPFGNPGMATAGSGDVLTGIIAALLAQGLSCREAATAGVLAHALAGDLAARRHSEMGMLAGDISKQLRHVWPAACELAAPAFQGLERTGDSSGGEQHSGNT